MHGEFITRHKFLVGHEEANYCHYVANRKFASEFRSTYERNEMLYLHRSGKTRGRRGNTVKSYKYYFRMLMNICVWNDRLRDWFLSVDADESGKITAEELRVALLNGDWSRSSGFRTCSFAPSMTCGFLMTAFDMETVKMLLTIYVRISFF